MSLTEALYAIGGGISAGAMVMTRMIPLRIMVIIGNVLLVFYGLAKPDYPTTALYAGLLVVNVYRLRQMRQLIAKVERASSGAISMNWLTTFTRRQKVKAGEIMFSRGDVATELFYVVSGVFRIPELRIDLGAGEMIGEFGLLHPGGRRTQSLQCVEEAEILIITYDEVNELFFQNPEFGYNFLRMVSNRLLGERDRLMKELAARPPGPAGQG